MQLQSLHPDFGVKVVDVDLRRATTAELYPDIRALFETHSLLLFRDQHLSENEHLALARLFGPIEDRSSLRMDGPEKISPVSNVGDDGDLCLEDDLHLLNLQSNMLWHTDSTFLPVPALVNLLQAIVVPSEGGATEFVSSRAGFARLPAAFQTRLRRTFFWHRYSHSRARIDPELAKQELFTMWADQKWRAVWKNPVNGTESLYIASHVFAVEGEEESEGAAFVEALLEAVTPPEAVYAHQWQVGDLVLWDERAVLHRGTPWPYEEPRVLASVCVSARDLDGLNSVR